jgi:hypothetical protein
LLLWRSRGGKALRKPARDRWMKYFEIHWERDYNSEPAGLHT